MGTDVPAVLFALLDGAIAVAGTLWFLSWLRCRRLAHGVMMGKAARASYAAYVIYPLALTAAMVRFAWRALAPKSAVRGARDRVILSGGEPRFRGGCFRCAPAPLRQRGPGTSAAAR